MEVLALAGEMGVPVWLRHVVVPGLTDGPEHAARFAALAHTLPTLGITATFVDIHDLDAVEQAVQENTRAIYVETLGNPNSDIPDLDALADLAHRPGVPLVVDTTFATPFLRRPLEHGADIVIHSTTKYSDGHATSVGGMVIDGGTLTGPPAANIPA